MEMNIEFTRCYGNSCKFPVPLLGFRAKVSARTVLLPILPQATFQVHKRNANLSIWSSFTPCYLPVNHPMIADFCLYVSLAVFQWMIVSTRLSSHAHASISISHPFCVALRPIF